MFTFDISIFIKTLEMDERSSDLREIRPKILSAAILSTTGNDERFQNEVLRPIIKLQNDLLIAVFQNYITKHKNAFHLLTLPKKLEYIEHSIQRDIKFRNSLKGIIIGMFTVDEYRHYVGNSSALNKRMMNMVIDRLKDQIQLLDESELLLQ